ncbi:hypothetical protein OPQ81_010678 [Rhizoctonia solani]|nr:hypothetical protein OPQ81_010678 [Rhizoctonia solani]
MSTSNATTPDPNQPPTFNTNAASDLSAVIQELIAIGNIQDAIDTIPLPLPTPSWLIKGAKLAQFSGKVQGIKHFLQDLKDDIELQGSALTSDQQKVLYMASFLWEAQMAHNWVSGMHISHPGYFNNFAAFTEAFKAHFSSPNKVDKAL